jgi:hypothetical protein
VGGGDKVHRLRQEFGALRTIAAQQRWPASSLIYKTNSMTS